MELTTAHYVFHYSKNSTAELEINEIAALQEGCYSFISSCLHTNAKGKIHYHFFDTSEEVGSQYAIAHDNNDNEPCNGFALSETYSKDGLNHIYAVYNDNPYARLFTATTPRAGKLGGSFLYEESGALYDAFRERKAFINRNLEKDLPAMAYAVYEEDAIRFLIMVWTLPMEKMTMGQANLLTVTCLLMRDSVFRARNYYEAVRHTQVVGNTPVLQREPYRRLLDTYEDAVSRRLTVFALLKIGCYEDLGEIWGKLSTLVRANDYPGLGKDGTLYVLISNTDHSGAEIVAERLKRYGIAASVADPEEV